MTVLTFSNTALVGTNKVGKLKKDEHGYYHVVLGALEYGNSHGATYNLQSAQELLAPNSPFQRLIKKGRLWGEYGHPPPDGLSREEYYKRVFQIREEKQSHHIREVSIDTNAVEINGRRYIAIIGWVKPSGPYGKYLLEQLEDPNQCVSFSIRSITNDSTANGKHEKFLLTIITWDYVTEPGLDAASKWNSPSLESFNEMKIPLSALEEIVQEERSNGHGNESSISRICDVIERCHYTPTPLEDKAWSNW